MGSAFGAGADRPEMPTADDMLQLTAALYDSDVDAVDRLVIGGDWDPVFVLGFIESMCAQLLPLVVEDAPDLAAGDLWVIESVTGALDAQATPALRLVVAAANGDEDMRRAHTGALVESGPEAFGQAMGELMRMYRDLMHLLPAKGEGAPGA